MKPIQAILNSIALHVVELRDIPNELLETNRSKLERFEDDLESIHEDIIEQFATKLLS
jgi:hypothetical protein